jgi:hypothetical protein
MPGGKKGRGADANESHPVIISRDILRDMIECGQRTKGWAWEIYKRDKQRDEYVGRSTFRQKQRDIYVDREIDRQKDRHREIHKINRNINKQLDR